MSRGLALRQWLAGAVLCVCCVSAARAQAAGPAVSGVNAKLSAEGGLYDDEDAGLALGSVTMPLGTSWGVQLDGAAGGIDGEAFTGGGLHIFTRDPQRYLLGAFASFHNWNDIDIARLAVESELYAGRYTFGGVAGYEHVNIPATSAGLTVLTRDDDHAFAELDLSWYMHDNLRFTGGYHYEAESSLGVAGVEYMPRWNAAPVSLFVTGNFGEEEHNRITGGLRIYFGAGSDKPLIRRHREDDPRNYTPVFPQIVTFTPPPPPPPPPPLEEIE